MKKHYYLLPIILCFIILFASCLPPVSTTSATNPLTEQINALTKKIIGIDETVTKHSAAINDLQSGKLSKSEYTSTDSYKKAELYTRTEVDSKIAEVKTAIETQKTRIDQWTNPATSPSAGTTPTVPLTGSVTTSTNPQPLQQLFTGPTGSNTYYFTVRVNNGTNQWRYIKPIINLSVASGYQPAKVCDCNVNMSFGGYSIVGNHFPVSSTAVANALGKDCSGSGGINRQTETGNSHIQFTPDRTLWCINSNPATPVMACPSICTCSDSTTNTTTSVVAIPVYGGLTGTGEMQISPGQSVDILVTVNITTLTATVWNISVSITDRTT